MISDRFESKSLKVRTSKVLTDSNSIRGEGGSSGLIPAPPVRACKAWDSAAKYPQQIPRSLLSLSTTGKLLDDGNHVTGRVVPILGEKLAKYLS